MAAIVPVIPAVKVKRILYATDLSQASFGVLPVVAAIARHYGARVYAANVWSPSPYPLVSSEVVTVLDRHQELEVRKELDRLLRSDVLRGVQAEPVVRCGSPAEELERIVRQEKIDLAVASTHGRTGITHRVLGSITEEMVRSLSCPVLSVGPHMMRTSGMDRISNILFPTDFSQDSLSVLPYLASLAQEYHSHLTVLHVMSEDTKDSAAIKQADFLRQRMQQALWNEISPRCTADFVVESGNPVQQILGYARRVQAGLIGLGVRCATDIATRFHETAAYNILCKAECPVLTHHARFIQ